MTEAEPKTEIKPIFEIESLDDLRKVLVIAKGGNPEAQQAVVDFMNLKSTTERANFMDKITMLAVAQQDGLSENYPMFKSFGLVSRAISSATMGWKSKKSDQLVQIIQQTPNLGDLTSASEDVRQGVISKILGGKKE
jgi:hypothetical protein